MSKQDNRQINYELLFSWVTWVLIVACYLAVSNPAVFYNFVMARPALVSVISRFNYPLSLLASLSSSVMYYLVELMKYTGLHARVVVNTMATVNNNLDHFKQLGNIVLACVRSMLRSCLETAYVTQVLHLHRTYYTGTVDLLGNISQKNGNLNEEARSGLVFFLTFSSTIITLVSNPLGRLFSMATSASGLLLISLTWLERNANSRAELYKNGGRRISGHVRRVEQQATFHASTRSGECQNNVNPKQNQIINRLIEQFNLTEWTRHVVLSVSSVLSKVKDLFEKCIDSTSFSALRPFQELVTHKFEDAVFCARFYSLISAQVWRSIFSQPLLKSNPTNTGPAPVSGSRGSSQKQETQFRVIQYTYGGGGTSRLIRYYKDSKKERPVVLLLKEVLDSNWQALLSQWIYPDEDDALTVKDCIESSIFRASMNTALSGCSQFGTKSLTQGQDFYDFYKTFISENTNVYQEKQPLVSEWCTRDKPTSDFIFFTRYLPLLVAIEADKITDLYIDDIVVQHWCNLNITISAKDTNFFEVVVEKCCKKNIQVTVNSRTQLSDSIKQILTEHGKKIREKTSGSQSPCAHGRVFAFPSYLDMRRIRSRELGSPEPGSPEQGSSQLASARFLSF
ncbi:MAG: hypothetical protein CMF46_03315 [Legionellales bacterium]|nr:hypothetical protein [Legionellales bacterium]